MKVTQHPSPSPQSLEKSLASEKVQNPKTENNSTVTPAANQGPSTGRGTEVNISEQAMLMKKAAELAHAAPDFRADKVEALKKKIQDGTYRVDNAAIADRLVDEHLADFTKNPL